MSYIIDRQDKKFLDDVAASIREGLAKRFPDGSPEDLMIPMAEAMLEAYWNGARAAEMLLRDEDTATKREAAKLVMLNG